MAKTVFKLFLLIVLLGALAVPTFIPHGVALAAITDTVSFYASSYSTLQATNAVYATAHDSATGTVGTGSVIVGQTTAYIVYRGGLVFDTSGVPGDATVSAASLWVYVFSDGSATDFNITVVDGSSLENPQVTSDYGDLLSSTTSYGALSTAGIGTGWKEIALNASGLSAIVSSGTTKFGIRSSKDISSTVPITNDVVTIDGVAGDNTNTHLAYLSVTFSTNYTQLVLSTSSSDGSIQSTSGVYLTAHSGGSLSVNGGGTTATVGQSLSAGTYYVIRGGLNFNTAIIPDTATIGSAYLRLYFTQVNTSRQYYVAVVNGSDLDDPMITGDFAQLTDDTTVVGSIDRDSIAVTANNYLALDSVGMSLINKAGQTRLALRTSRDILIDAPIGVAETAVFSTEESANPEPQLVVYYTNLAVGTSSATGVTSSTATFNGYIIDDDGLVLEGWFEYGTTVSYGSTTSPHVTSLTINEPFSSGVTGLSRATGYHFRAVASTPTGITVVGGDKTFTTLPDPPSVSTYAAIDVDSNSATLRGYLSDDGGEASLYRFRWGLSSGAYSWSTSWTGSITTGTTFTQVVGGLNPGTTYYFIAEARNTGGQTTADGESFFTTSLASPVVSTRPATYVSVSTAMLNGYLDSDGGDTNSYMRFQYGLTVAYGTNTAWVGGFSTGEVSSVEIQGLAVGTTYHFRVQAYNSFTGISSPVSGSDTTLSTPASIGNVGDFSATATSSTSISLSWSLASGSWGTLVRYKSGGYPSATNEGYIAHFSIGVGATVNGLTPGVTYYFSAWGFAPDDYYSSSAAQALATTLAGTSGASDVFNLPSSSGYNWFTNPNASAITSKMPTLLLDTFTSVASSWGITLARLFLILALLLATGLGTFIYVKTKRVIAALVVMGMVIVPLTGSIIPGWMLFMFVLLGVGIGFASRRETA